MVRLPITLLLFIAVPSLADRTVSFVPTENRGGVQISNPSSVSQSVTVICKKEDGTVVVNKAATIASGMSTMISLSACKYHEHEGYGGGMYRCSGSNGTSSMINYATASAACSADHHVCSLTEYAANVGGSPPSSSAWLTHSGIFSQSYCSSYPSCSWSDYSTPTHYPVTGYGSNDYCATGSMGGGSAVQYCSFGSASTTYSGVMCCPNTPPGIPAGTYGFCSITVTGDSGYLITPSFKGGAPF